MERSPDTGAQTALPSQPTKTETEFSTCKEFSHVTRTWLMSQGINFRSRYSRDQRGWTDPMDMEDNPGIIKITIWDCPYFFYQSGGSPMREAEKILLTVTEIDRIWRAAQVAFPNMNLTIEEFNESGGKLVFINFPINKEALDKFLRDEDYSEDEGDEGKDDEGKDGEGEDGEGEDGEAKDGEAKDS